MPHPGRLRLVVDTNIWISYLLTSSFTSLVNGWRTGRFVVLFSEAQISELLDVLSRPRIRNRVPERIANTFITALRRNATRVETTSIVDVCRDKKDNFLLALAQDGLADLLITGDEDLLFVERFGGTIILSPSEFTSAFN